MPEKYLKMILNSPVYDVAHETPLDRAPRLSDKLENNVFIKREDLQPVFSFKIRGAYNKIVQLSPSEKQRGVIAASAGNHAQGVALAAKRLRIKATIVMPETTPEIKIDGVKKFGAKVVPALPFPKKEKAKGQPCRTAQHSRGPVSARFPPAFPDKTRVSQGSASATLARLHHHNLQASDLALPLCEQRWRAGVAGRRPGWQRGRSWRLPRSLCLSCTRLSGALSWFTGARSIRCRTRLRARERAGGVWLRPISTLARTLTLPGRLPPGSGCVRASFRKQMCARIQENASCMHRRHARTRVLSAAVIVSAGHDGGLGPFDRGGWCAGGARDRLDLRQWARAWPNQGCSLALLQRISVGLRSGNIW